MRAKDTRNALGLETRGQSSMKVLAIYGYGPSLEEAEREYMYGRLALRQALGPATDIFYRSYVGSGSLAG